MPYVQTTNISVAGNTVTGLSEDHVLRSDKDRVCVNQPLSQEEEVKKDTAT